MWLLIDAKEGLPLLWSPNSKFKIQNARENKKKERKKQFLRLPLSHYANHIFIVSSCFEQYWLAPAFRVFQELQHSRRRFLVQGCFGVALHTNR
jgi:hypothetical protein